MNLPLLLLLLFATQAACMYISKKVTSPNATQESYFLGDRAIPFFPLMMTFVATLVGGGAILGAADEAYRYGGYSLFYGIGSSLGLILLSRGIGQRMQEMNLSTVAQVLEVAYGSKALRQLASLLSIASLFLILVAQIVASKRFLISLGIESDLLFLLCWCLVIFYTASGGFKAVVATDVFQSLFFLLVFGAAFFAAYIALPNLGELVFRPPAESFDLSFNKGIGWLLMPLLFVLIEQDMGQRCFAARSPRTLRFATLGAALVITAISTIPVLLGIIGRTLPSVSPDRGSILMQTIQALTNPTFSAFVGCAILSVILSTADSLINAISCNLTQDFQIRPSLKFSIGSSFLIAFAALVTSYYFSSVLDLLVLSYELSVSCLFVPTLIAFFQKRGSFLAALLSITLGAISFCAFQFFPSLPGQLLSLLFSLFGYLLGTRLSPSPQKTTSP